MIFDADDVYEIEESYKEEINKLKQCYCNRTDCGARIKDSKKYDSLQQRIDKAIDIIEEVLFIGVKDYRSQLEIIEDILKGSEE